jgi:PAS domain S-box-containing protein
VAHNLIPGDAREAEHAQVTLDSIADAILSSDNAGNVTYLNSAAAAMTGWSRSEAKGRPLGEVLQIVDGATKEPLMRNPLRLALRLRPILEFRSSTEQARL